MLSYLNWNFALTLGYLNPALNNPSSQTQGRIVGARERLNRRQKMKKKKKKKKRKKKSKEWRATQP